MLPETITCAACNVMFNENMIRRRSDMPKIREWERGVFLFFLLKFTVSAFVCYY